MDMNTQQIRKKISNVERHQPAYRFQLDKSEWCEISLTLEREDGDLWELVELFVSSHNYESNQMTLHALDQRLVAIIVSKVSSAKAWEVAKHRASSIFQYIRNELSHYGIEFQFGQMPG